MNMLQEGHFTIKFFLITKPLNLSVYKTFMSYTQGCRETGEQGTVTLLEYPCQFYDLI